MWVLWHSLHSSSCRLLRWSGYVRVHMENLACMYVCAGPLRLKWDRRWQTVSSHHHCGCYDRRGPTIKNLKHRLKAHEPSNGHTMKREKPFFPPRLKRITHPLVFSRQKHVKVPVKTSMSLPLQLFCFRCFYPMKEKQKTLKLDLSIICKF